MARTAEKFDPDAPLNSCEATAVYLRISRGLCYSQARNGTLPAVRIGSRLLVKTVPLLAMLADPTPEQCDSQATDETTLESVR